MDMSELINPPDESTPPQIASWPDSGGVAEITWVTAAGRTFRQELGSKDEAARLLQSIADDEDLTLISAQLRRSGTGQSG
jgi:hypothetical protein